MQPTALTDANAASLRTPHILSTEIDRDRDATHAPEGPEPSLRTMSAPLRTETCHDFSELTGHAKAWDDLAWRAPQRNPTLLPAWTIAFLRHQLKPNETWLCSFAYAGDELVGVLPLIVASHPILGSSYPLLRTPTGPFSPSGDILLESEVARAALDSLLLEVGRQVPGHLGIKLAKARQNSVVWLALRNGSTGYMVVGERPSPVSVLDVTGDFAAYLQHHANLRRNLGRYHKKLNRHGDVTFEIATDDPGTDFFQTFLALEASGWKGRSGTAIISDDRVKAFYQDLATALTVQGRWEWHILRAGTRVVAAGMGVRCGTSLMLPKIAFDEGLSDCQPGTLLTGEVIKAAFADPDLSEINHMSNAKWHKLWHMSEEAYGSAHLVRRSLAAALFHLPLVLLLAGYRDFIRPNVPVALEEALHRFRRRGHRKPRRAAEAGAAQKPNGAA